MGSNNKRANRLDDNRVLQNRYQSWRGLKQYKSFSYPAESFYWGSLGQASYKLSLGQSEGADEEDDSVELEDSGYTDEEGNTVFTQEFADTSSFGDDGDGFVMLANLGAVDPADVLRAIDEITDRYLTDVEGDLIDLMRKGRRPVEISRILNIPECEVVRLRRNCFRKIKVIFMFDYYRDKASFVKYAIGLLNLNDKQARILSMFFDYYGLRPIAEVIGTRPSNIHRSLESIKTKLEGMLKEGDEFYPYLEAFTDFKYLNVLNRGPQGLPS